MRRALGLLPKLLKMDIREEVPLLIIGTLLQKHLEKMMELFTPEAEGEETRF